MKKTRTALLMSVLALLLCASMFVGSTFAWFTDSVSSTNNIITAGNLDVTLDYYDEVQQKWVAIDANQSVFDESTLWEPGHVEVVALRIANAGTLAFKYNLSTLVIDELTSTNVYGDALKLSDYLAVRGEAFDDEADALAKIADRATARTLSDSFKFGTDLVGEDSLLEKGEADFFVLAIEMPETIGNEANHKTGVTAPKITFGITVVATQKVYEEDSFGNDYDEDAPLDFTPVSTVGELEGAIGAGKPNILVVNPIGLTKPIQVKSNTVINGNGNTLFREAGFTGNMFEVAAGSKLTLDEIVLDGGAVWTSSLAADGSLNNTGDTATGSLVSTIGNGSVVLESGTVLQNNDGASAVSLATRGGGTVTLNGAYIINNRSAGGAAIWGGGNIVINEGSKINGNYATSIGGAIRMVNGYNAITLTMNGGEMNNNVSAGNGGAIWGGNNATYNFNGGEMAYNSAAAGGAIWTGTYEKYNISGDFKLHDNSATTLGGAIRFCDHASLNMTGGEVYGNTVNGASSAFYLNNNSASITGGTVSDNFSYSGGLGLTIGNADITGVITYGLSTNHNTAYLASEFGSFKFTTEKIDKFNFKPADTYVYTAGDEAKLECLNSGYSVTWDSATSTFVLQAN